MMSVQNRTFNEVATNYLEKLDLFTHAITRAHGKSHPEAFEVRELFTKISEKVKIGHVNKPDLDAEFTQLRIITDNYKVPGDVCETYETTYTMLSELDKAYQA
ncbi:iron-sulfur cluster repair di-iron protein, ric [Niallia sp. XMNu-256]|uniref:iron-sulfur cluster repair di-iron protein, ric n=1 Tax=Niallia sp. XMNu-256 TaxID=3082444 RepID=UPI0030D2B795